MYTFGYRIAFTNIEGQLVEAHIWDRTQTSDDPGAEQQILDLEPAGNPCTIQIIDNNEDKFTPIKAKMLTLRFLSNQWFNLNTFIDDEAADDKWLVEVRYNSNLIFAGFLILDDLHQEFRDDHTHREVKLTANCGLSMLRDVPLTMFDGRYPQAAATKHYKIIDYIAWALSKTGHQLPIRVVNGLQHQDAQGQPGYDSTYLHCKTFEKDINETVSCYEALQIILGMECFIHQWQGQWWVRRVDEYEGNITYQESYTWQGVYSNTTTSYYQKNIGLDEEMTLVVPAATVTPKRPAKSIRINNAFEYPKEIIDNINFFRGGVFTPLQPPPNHIYYIVDDWTLLKGDILSPIAGTGYAYIDRLFEAGQEKSRDIIIAPQGVYHWLRCNPIPVDVNDKATISIDFKSFSNISGDNTITHAIAIVLEGEDGTRWIFGGQLPAPSRPKTEYRWMPLNNTINKQARVFHQWVAKDVDETFWQTLSADIEAVPRSGELFIYLTAPSGGNIAYNNLRFSYKPFINKSYILFNGQYHKIESGIDRKFVVEEDVRMSDGIRRIFKGGLFIKTPENKFSLANRWYNAAVPHIRAEIPNVTWQYLHPHGYIQAFSVWNQHRRTFRQLDAYVRGLGNDLPDLMHTYFFTDKSPHTNNKRFMLLRYEIDLYRCTLNGRFAEVFDDVIGKKYDEPHEFKYIEDR